VRGELAAGPLVASTHDTPMGRDLPAQAQTIARLERAPVGGRRQSSRRPGLERSTRPFRASPRGRPFHGWVIRLCVFHLRRPPTAMGQVGHFSVQLLNAWMPAVRRGGAGRNDEWRACKPLG
jgi:hypothetical protein